ncbi:MAG TPA: hypothetical protein VGD62_12035 [Acidobacteriaceae bacterium]
MPCFLPRIQCVVASCVFAAATSLCAQFPSVLTAGYDNARTTTNNGELFLIPQTVGNGNFGKVGQYAVDGQVVAQPLYVPWAHIGKRFVNTLFVATMNNSVYAFNADQPGSAPLWQVNFGPPVPNYYAGTCPANYATGAQLGILGTPVIDPDLNALYVVSASPVPNQAAYLHTLHALDFRTGAPKHGKSMLIQASVPGTGSASVNGTVTMGQANMIQRPALLLSGGTVYVAMGGCGPDPSPYHGWVLGYNAGNITQQTAVYNSTPDGDEGGIWQAGRGLVGDSAGSVYFETGNGTSDNQLDFGDSLVKLSPSGVLQDWFTPSDVQNLNNLDLDLSTTSPLLTPDTNLLIGGGKQGVVYVTNAGAMGHSGGARQTFLATNSCTLSFSGCQKIHSMAYWRNLGPSQLYLWGTNDTLRAFTYTNGQFNTTPNSQSTATAGYPGGILTVTSVLGLPGTGIVWALTPGVLHAFSAINVANELWNSNQNSSRDALSGNFHFEQFTVVAGRVYVPDNQNHVVVYGLLR